MADEYASIVGRVSPAVITGKPIALGGSLGRDDATARGGFYLLRHLEAELSLSRSATVAIPGFGNAGSHMARLLADAGGVTVSYFEWVQNRQGLYWTVEEIHSRLKAAMEAEGRAVWNLLATARHQASQRRLCSMR
jgi:glutamate dehydrogenase (NADP+)